MKQSLLIEWENGEPLLQAHYYRGQLHETNTGEPAIRIFPKDGPPIDGHYKFGEMMLGEGGPTKGYENPALHVDIMKLLSCIDMPTKSPFGGRNNDTNLRTTVHVINALVADMARKYGPQNSPEPTAPQTNVRERRLLFGKGL